MEILQYDTQTKEAEGLNIINRLAEREVLAVVFSSLFEIAPQLERLQVAMISMCSSKPGLSAMNAQHLPLKPVVAAWVKAYGIKKAVIIHDAEDAVSKAEGAILPGLLKANGVFDIMTYRTKDTDYSAQITKANFAFGSCYQNAAAIAKEAHKQGLKVPMVGGACAGAPGFIKIAGSAAEGAYMSTAAWIDDPRKSANVRDFGKPPYGGPRAYEIYARRSWRTGVTNKPGDRRTVKRFAPVLRPSGTGLPASTRSVTALAAARWSTASVSK